MMIVVVVAIFGYLSFCREIVLLTFTKLSHLLSSAGCDLVYMNGDGSLYLSFSNVE